MARRKLTATTIERLPPPEHGQLDYFDAAYPALALRVSASGVRSWTYHGRVNGKLRRVTLGRWPALGLRDARQAAGKAAEDMQAGRDPATARAAARQAQAQRERDDFAAVAEEWLKRDQAGNRSADEVRRIIEKDVTPAWSGRAIHAISRRDAVELLDAIADRAPVMARRTHSHLHRLFRWAVGRGIVASNPLADLPKPGSETPRERVLTDAELRRLWEAAGAVGYPFGPLVRLLMLTAARRDEIGSLRWSEVDLEAATVRLEGARTKGGAAHEIPLGPTAKAILEALPRIGPADYVFTTTGETPVSGWSRAKSQLDRLLADPDPIPAWRLHDIRRTVATRLQALGERLEVTEAVLGHVSGSRAGIVGVYQRHTFSAERRAALRRWGAELARIVAGKSSRRVVRIRA